MTTPNKIIQQQGDCDESDHVTSRDTMYKPSQDVPSQEHLLHHDQIYKGAVCEMLATLDMRSNAPTSTT
jgi:hypothetical protein